MADQIIYIGDLDLTKPSDIDFIEQGDNELRTLKLSIKSTFPNITAPITISNRFLNQLDTRTEVKYTSSPPDDYFLFKDKVVMPFLTTTYVDQNFLSVSTDGTLKRSFPIGPLGSILISVIKESEMNNKYPGHYIICDGRVLDNTSNLFKLLNPVAGYRIPDFKTNNRTARTANSTNLLLSITGGKAKLDQSSFTTAWDTHTHPPHVHVWTLNYTGPYNALADPAGGAGGQTYRHMINQTNQTISVGPPKRTTGSPPQIVNWVLPIDTHYHTLTVSSDAVTRSKEIRLNYYIRIN